MTGPIKLAAADYVPKPCDFVKKHIDRMFTSLLESAEAQELAIDWPTLRLSIENTPAGANAGAAAFYAGGLTIHLEAMAKQ